MGGCFTCLSNRLELDHDQVPKEVPMEDTLSENVTQFSYESLKMATNDFSNSGVLRRDLKSISYKGTIRYGGSKVIVKVYHENHYTRGIDFISMINIMSRVKHQNVLKFIGCCIEDDHRIVVHEYVGKYSLFEMLFDSKRTKGLLDWPKRASICHGIAHALDYLHNGIKPRVVLRAVSICDFLIDHNCNPKLEDFDRSCLFGESELYRSDPLDRTVGTMGYFDPEYVITGRYSEKVDVYAFGIMLLRIINNRDRDFLYSVEGKVLVDWAWELRGNGRYHEIVDPCLSEFSEDEVKRFVNVALSCVQLSSDVRPSMSEVRQMLSDGYDLSNLVLTNPRHSRESVDEKSLYWLLCIY